MGMWSDWYEKNAGKENILTTVEFVLKAIDKFISTTVPPVGWIEITAVNMNPANRYPGTVWEPYGAGRVLVGVDTNQTEFNVVEKTGGEKTHTLTVNEMPSHTHSIYKYSGNNAASTGSRVAHGYWENRLDNTISSNSTGGGASHNNLQPYITCYMFKRIS
jgi:hypothetical protein